MGPINTAPAIIHATEAVKTIVHIHQNECDVASVAVESHPIQRHFKKKLFKKDGDFVFAESELGINFFF